jgi:8-oxo-dGTP pyrophosphatase MutT (NUDIX family)
MTTKAFCEPFLSQLRSDLQGSLPGRTAQERMAPRPRLGSWPADQASSAARQGGVLVLLYSHAGQIFLPLIRRPEYPGVHGGQIGLPGGGYDLVDSDLIATALRETSEEIGVHASQQQVLGVLTPIYVAASNYLVQPAVAWIEGRPEFYPDPYEVAELIEAPLGTLLDPAAQHVECWSVRDQSIEVPYFAVARHKVWGATAMMLSELLALPAMAAVRGADGCAGRV